MPNTNPPLKSAGPAAALKPTNIAGPTASTPISADIPAALTHFDQLPDSAHVRIRVVAAWRGTSPSTVWRHVKAGLIPAPSKLGPGTTAWRVGDLRAIKG